MKIRNNLRFREFQRSLISRSRIPKINIGLEFGHSLSALFSNTLSERSSLEVNNHGPDGRAVTNTALPADVYYGRDCIH
jgi:hypothetical protein